jgi:hypothetical protein
MGVEYARYLLPRPSSFRPSSETLLKLIEALRTERWLPSVTTRNVRHLQNLHARLEGRCSVWFNGMPAGRLSTSSERLVWPGFLSH